MNRWRALLLTAALGASACGSASSTDASSTDVIEGEVPYEAEAQEAYDHCATWEVAYQSVQSYVGTGTANFEDAVYLTADSWVRANNDYWVTSEDKIEALRQACLVGIYDFLRPAPAASATSSASVPDSTGAGDVAECGYPPIGFDTYDDGTSQPIWDGYDGPEAWSQDPSCAEYGEDPDVLREQWAG